MNHLGSNHTRQNLNLYLVLFGISAASILINIVFVAQVGHFLWSSTPELAEEFGASDKGFYLTLALDLQDLKINPDNFWILALWPPGAPVSFAVLEILPGTLLPYLIIAISLFWAIPPYLLISSSPKSATLFVASLALWTLNPIFHNWIFGSGIFYSESLGVPVFAASIALLLRSLSSPNSKRYLLFSGALLGVSLYFRATLVPITLLAFLSIAVLFTVWALSNAFRSRSKRSLRKWISELKPMMAGYFQYGLVVFSVAAPWALIVFTLVNPGSISWSANEYLWVQKWTKSDELNAQGGSFLVEGGANWPCVLDPLLCSLLSDSSLTRGDFHIAQNAAFDTLASNFGTFLGMRVENLATAYLSLPGSAIGSNQSPVTLVSIIALASTYLLLSFQKEGLGSRPRFMVNSIFLISVIVSASSFIIMAVYHVETRYFLPGHVSLLISAGFFTSQLLKRNKTLT